MLAGITGAARIEIRITTGLTPETQIHIPADKGPAIRTATWSDIITKAIRDQAVAGTVRATTPTPFTAARRMPGGELRFTNGALEITSGKEDCLT